MTFLQSLNTSQIIILGIVVVVVAFLGSFQIDWTNKQIKWSPRSTKQVMNIIIDYADFKWTVYQKREECERLLKLQIRERTKSLLNQYHYNVIEKLSREINFSSILWVYEFVSMSVVPVQLNKLLTVYEVNHLANKTDEEISEKANSVYFELADVMRTLLVTKARFTPPQLETIYKIFTEMRTEYIPETERVLKKFREYSKLRNSLYTALNEYDLKIRENTLKLGHLPIGSISGITNVCDNILNIEVL